MHSQHISNCWISKSWLRIMQLLSPEVLDVHIFILFLPQAVFYEVFSLSCLAREHGLSHGFGSGAVTPRQWSVHTFKPWHDSPRKENVLRQIPLWYFMTGSSVSQIPVSSETWHCVINETYSGLVLVEELACTEMALSLETGVGGRGLDEV